MTRAIHRWMRPSILACVALAIALLSPTASAASEAPVKQVLSSHIGWEVDKSTGSGVCTVESNDECQPGKPSVQPGGFEYAEGIATASNGNVYVADRGNHRVQELTAAGQFVLMFGKKVNQTTGGDICTEEEVETKGVKCGAGIEGSGTGEFGLDQAIAVDPTSGDVYVRDVLFGQAAYGERVQKFTASGEFVLEIGRGVNETTKGNVCTEQEMKVKNVKCTGPALLSFSSPGTQEAGAFILAGPIAVGGPEDTLYVGEEHRVQELGPQGEFKGEISLEAISAERGYRVVHLAADRAGSVYLIYSASSGSGGNVIREFSPNGQEKTLVINPRPPANAAPSTAGLGLFSIAVDSVGRLAVAEGEAYSIGTPSEGVTLRGSLYAIDSDGVRLITEFANPGIDDIAFGNGDRLYASATGGFGSAGSEILAYRPVPVAALRAGVASCKEGPEHGSDAVFQCTLQGEVNPWGISETEAWFEWGPTTLESTSPAQTIATVETSVPAVPVVVEAVPNKALYYRLGAYDRNVKPPESALASETASVTVPTAPPRIAGEQAVVVTTSSTAVLFGEVNPENTATTYAFQYIPRSEYESDATCREFQASCPGLRETETESSAAYGNVATTMEATGLRPATAYRYRFFATNVKDEPAVNEKGGLPIPEGEFTTAPTATPRAQTGTASVTGATSAIISGNVDPDGEPATYVFELGVYRGPETLYGTVSSGPAGAGAGPVEKSLALNGLQPGTTYAYRIRIESGYGSATGTVVLFTTAGLPDVLPIPPAGGLLAVPAIAFPMQVKVTPRSAVCRRARRRGKRGRCVKVKRKGKAHARRRPLTHASAVRTQGRGM